MEELKLSFSNLFDLESQKRMGKLLCADAILSGTITDMVNSIKVNARLIETETGRIVAVAETEISKSDKVKRLTGTGIVLLPPAPPPPLPEPREHVKSIFPKGNLIVNGDFEEPWTVGWKRVVAAPSRGANHVRVVYSADGEGDDDLYLRHTGESYMTLFQSIPVVSCNLLFSASFKLGPVKRNGATSMIELEYGDKKGRYLGSTRLVNYHYSPFIYAKRRSSLNTGFKHHIKMGTRWYKHYTINLREEIINNLPGIMPDRVKEIVINFYVGGNHKRCVSELYADNLNLWYK